MKRTIILALLSISLVVNTFSKPKYPTYPKLDHYVFRAAMVYTVEKSYVKIKKLTKKQLILEIGIPGINGSASREKELDCNEWACKWLSHRGYNPNKMSIVCDVINNSEGITVSNSKKKNTIIKGGSYGWGDFSKIPDTKEDDFSDRKISNENNADKTGW